MAGNFHMKEFLDPVYVGSLNSGLVMILGTLGQRNAHKTANCSNLNQVFAYLYL